MSSGTATLRAFELYNFKLFRHERLSLHPEITVLVGQNDVGKSILLSAIRLYGAIQRAGFRGPLSDEQFSTSGDQATKFTATWDVNGQTWKHQLVLSADDPEERVECADRFWSWNPKRCVLKTERGEFSTTNTKKRYRTLAQIKPSDWKLDTDAPDSIHAPLAVLQQLQTPPAYLFEPSALGIPTPLDVERPGRNGYGWALWLQEIINRRNEDLVLLEKAVRSLFPFFGRVRVREERVHINREVEVFGQHGGNNRLTTRNDEPIKSARDELINYVKSQQSRRDVLIELSPSEGKSTTIEGEPTIIDAADASSGLLLALAHFALVYADEVGRLILLEEPENGLNAKITLAMMQAFLEAVRHRNKQLVLTTHNAWWLDLVPPEAIRILRRDDQGAHIHEPDPSMLQNMRDELDIYPSEIMSAYGPEGLLQRHRREVGE